VTAKTNHPAEGPVRYAVVGLGHIAQVAVLPAFAHAKRNSVLAGLVSSDPTKLRKLSRKYRVEHVWSADQYDECLASGAVDAVYLAIPNHVHCEWTLRAARAGIHVLCEKPLALSEEDCEAMIQASRENGVKLMTAYRLHFERANLEAVEITRSGRLGIPRLFDSVVTMNVTDRDNIRLRRETGGGPVWDLGVYCINAARYLFQAEPIEVTAVTATRDDPRFDEVEEMASAILRFPGERLATFTCGFGSADVSSYRIVGTKGVLQVDPAYEYAEPLRHQLTVRGRKSQKRFPKRDQFAAELIYFSGCVLAGEEPEASGREGLADVRVIRAIQRSAASGRTVRLEPFEKRRRPDLRQELRLPPVPKPSKPVHAASPHG
jgi:glucose-fructose oxidoreductase